MSKLRVQLLISTHMYIFIYAHHVVYKSICYVSLLWAQSSSFRNIVGQKSGIICCVLGTLGARSFD